ncbi:MAG: MGH1-like glycoside hydrolase domain-containing protein [Candidatus Dormibacterales bacterium]
MSRKDLHAEAVRVLRANDRGGWTVPSETQYPHQWNWDSGFAAIGWATFDPARAAREVESLLLGRWRDGMLPHLRYDRAASQDYFPGPDWWPGAAERVAIPGTLTSGISNPPVAAVAACRVCGRLPKSDRAGYWSHVQPALAAWLRWFLVCRRPRGWGLPATLHPWETGWDNSPRWQMAGAAAMRPARAYRRLDVGRVPSAQRPQDHDYDTYLALAELLDGEGYDLGRYLARSPFAVSDVVLDAIWYRAAAEMNEVSVDLGLDAVFGEDELAEFAAAFQTAHWDEEAGTYLDFDLVSGRRVRVRTAAGAAALFSGLASPARAEAVWKRAADSAAAPIPTVDPREPSFEPRRYWRGPVWVNVNWLAAEGLERCGLAGAASGLRRATLEMVEAAGPAEYFDALEGLPLGVPGFTWTAALVLDMLESERGGG